CILNMFLPIKKSVWQHKNCSDKIIPHVFWY
ncbi:MAG: hypothetical protein ACI8YC_001395, partial [Salibacteraceae bacterium]